MTNDNTLAKVSPATAPAASPAAPGPHPMPVARVGGAQFVEESGPNPLMRLHLLLYGRYKWAIILGLLLSCAGGLTTWLLMQPKYQVTGYIRIRPFVAPVLAQTDQNGMLPMFESFVALQESLLRGQHVLLAASGDPKWTALGHHSTVWGNGIPADALVVDHPKNSEIITVEYTDRDAQVASVAVDCVIRAYINYSGEANGDGDSGRLGLIDTRRSALMVQKDEIQKRISALAEQEGSDDLQRRHEFKIEELNRLESQLDQIDFELSLARAKAGETASATTTAPAARQPAVQLTPAAALLTRDDVARVDIRMRDYLAQESRLSILLGQRQMTLGENHREVLAIRNEQEILERQIDDLLASYQERARDTLSPSSLGADGKRLSVAELVAQQESIKKLYDKRDAEAKALGQTDLQIRALKQEVDGIDQQLDALKARSNLLDLEARGPNRIVPINNGEMPNAPTPNKRIPATAAASVAGLLGGAGLVALRGLADRRVRSVMHMQHLEPTVRMLGVLPVLPENLADPDQKSQAAHCVHQIRNLLEISVQAGKGRVFAITSPAAGDGKTSLTLALGLSFAGAGSRTLLIDCDMVGGGLTSRLNALVRRRIGNILRREGLLTEHQIKEAIQLASNTPNKKFGEILIGLGYVTASDLERALALQQESSVGLLEALDGDPVAACTTPVLAEGLFVLPLGEAAAHHTSQMSAKALRRILKEARGQFDVVIIDTGPILGSLEASIVAREADEVILAIARDEQAPFVTKTLALLASLGAHMAGLVFNRATPRDVAYSDYGSSTSLGSLRSKDRARTSARDPKSPASIPPRLGPVASAIVNANGNGAAQETKAP